MKTVMIVLMFIIFVNFAITKEINCINISKSGTNLNIKFNLPQIQFNNVLINGDYYKTIALNDFGTSTSVGRPKLPQISFNIAIEGDQKPSTNIINKTRYEQFLDIHILPYQAPRAMNIPPTANPFNYDAEYYNSIDSVSKEIINLSEPYSIGGVRGVTVTIYPFSYNPAVKKLTIIDNLDFLIEMEGYAETANNHSKYYNEFLNDVFINYEGNNTNLNNLILSNSNYLIITAPELLNSDLQNFIDYKTSKGYAVEYYTTSTLGNTNNEIKTFIQQRYNNLSTRPEFILLVGDVDKIPCWT